MLAKEAARAESRNLATKVTSLQERMEEDREKFRVAFEKWTAEKAALQQQLEAAQHNERRASGPTPREEPFPTAARAQPVILFVHSDVGIRAMWKHTLEQAGYTILTAADGLEGLRTASQHRPDVVVAETIMPKMNARELIQLLKSKRETAGTKIVLLGGTRGDAERASDYRADGIVQNPSDFRALRETLVSVLAM
jgi:CheY-like chemotaxis protein